jgi:S-DNA-T family DNA segregation ATPase FtsK/SpoIIIE
VVALCHHVVVWGYRRRYSTARPDRSPSLGIALGGFALLLLASASLEALRLHSLRPSMPLAPGRLIGAQIGGGWRPRSASPARPWFS